MIRLNLFCVFTNKDSRGFEKNQVQISVCVKLKIFFPIPEEYDH